MIANGLLDIDGGDPIGLVVETGCRYARPLSYPQQIEIGLAVAEIGRSSVRYAIGIFGAGEAEPAAEGFFVHVYVDRLTRRPVPVPADWRARMQTLA